MRWAAGHLSARRPLGLDKAVAAMGGSPTVRAASRLLSLDSHRMAELCYCIAIHFAGKQAQFKVRKLIQTVFKTNQKKALLKNTETKEKSKTPGAGASAALAGLRAGRTWQTRWW